MRGSPEPCKVTCFAMRTRLLVIAFLTGTCLGCDSNSNTVASPNPSPGSPTRSVPSSSKRVTAETKEAAEASIEQARAKQQQSGSSARMHARKLLQEQP